MKNQLNELLYKIVFLAHWCKGHNTQSISEKCLEEINCLCHIFELAFFEILSYIQLENFQSIGINLSKNYLLSKTKSRIYNFNILISYIWLYLAIINIMLDQIKNYLKFELSI